MEGRVREFLRQCEIEVSKEVRCLPTCNPASLGPEEGWVEDPAVLVVTPGACLQYRIVVDNVSGQVPLCAIKFNDQMLDGSGNFASGPANVQVSGPTTCANLAGDFNWDGVDVLCELDPPLDEAPSNPTHDAGEPVASQVRLRNVERVRGGAAFDEDLQNLLHPGIADACRELPIGVRSSSTFTARAPARAACLLSAATRARV